jgi:hypothetical protein
MMFHTPNYIVASSTATNFLGKDLEYITVTEIQVLALPEAYAFLLSYRMYVFCVR